MITNYSVRDTYDTLFAILYIGRFLLYANHVYLCILIICLARVTYIL